MEGASDNTAEYNMQMGDISVSLAPIGVWEETAILMMGLMPVCQHAKSTTKTQEPKSSEVY